MKNLLYGSDQKLILYSGFLSVKSLLDKYVQVAIDTVMPKRYIQGRNYQRKFKGHKKLMFTGPIGVGKSACLLVYWYNYIKLL